MKLSVVMPVYNERATIREIVQRVLNAPYEKEGMGGGLPNKGRGYRRS